MTWTPTHWKQAQEAWKTSKHLYQRLRKAGLKVTSPESRLTEELAQSISEDIDAEILRDLESVKRHGMFSLFSFIRPESSEPIWCSDHSLWFVNQHHLLLTSAYYQPSCNQPGTCSVGYRHYHYSGSIYASVESEVLEQRLRKAGLKTVLKEFGSREEVISRHGDKMVKTEFFSQVSALEGKP